MPQACVCVCCMCVLILTYIKDSAIEVLLHTVGLYAVFNTSNMCIETLCKKKDTAKNLVELNTCSDGNHG